MYMLTTTNCLWSSRCYPGTIPPDIGKLVNLATLNMNLADKLSGECERLPLRSHVQAGDRRISCFFAEFVLLPLTTTNCALSSRYSPGTIPPDIGKLVQLTKLDVGATKIEGATGSFSISHVQARDRRKPLLDLSSNWLSKIAVALTLCASAVWYNYLPSSPRKARCHQ